MEKLKKLSEDYLINSKLHLAEIKTQTPFYSFGKFGAMAYPLKKSQVEKLDINEIVYYLCTMGAGTKYKTKNGTTAIDLNGKMFYITAARLKKWIADNRDNPDYIKDAGTKDERIMVPFEMLTYLGKIDAETMKKSGVNDVGSSRYLDNIKVGRRKDWVSAADDQGYIGEKLYQSEFFQKARPFGLNIRVTKVVVTRDLPDEDAKYDKTDVRVYYEKELENA